MAKKPGTDLVNWDAELTKDAAIATAMEQNAGGGNFFSVKGGILTFNGMPMPDNQMGVIIVDHVLENVWYDGVFDPIKPAPPTCFAFGRDDKTMAPHATVVAVKQNPSATCAGCPKNEWASALTGRGKACRNVRKLGVIAGGHFDKTGKFAPFTDPDDYDNAAVAFLRLPVMSVKPFATFVLQVAGALNLPPHGIYTRIKVIPDAKSQFRVICEPLDKVPSPLLQYVFKKRKEAAAIIDTPYPLEMGDGSPAVKPAVKPKSAKKY